jgi:hypothetical protein
VNCASGVKAKLLDREFGSGSRRQPLQRQPWQFRYRVIAFGLHPELATPHLMRPAIVIVLKIFQPDQVVRNYFFVLGRKAIVVRGFPKRVDDIVE